MSYNIVFVGDLPCFNRELWDVLSTKNICSTITPNTTQLRLHLKQNYQNINLIVIGLTDNLSSTDTIISLQTKYLFRNIPFIIVGERINVMRGLALGAKDFIVTPCSASDFMSRILVTLESLKFSKVESSYQTIIQLSFKEYFLSEIKRAERGAYDLSLIFFSLVSIDSNALCDELTLHKLTKQVCSLIHSSLRTTDAVVQYGDFNIVSFLPFTSKSNAEHVCDKIKDLHSSHMLATSDSNSKCKLVSTITSYPDDGATPDDILFNAEQSLDRKFAMYL